MHPVYRLLTRWLDHPLAMGFLLIDGRVEVTIPKDVQPGNAYQLVRECLRWLRRELATHNVPTL